LYVLQQLELTSQAVVQDDVHYQLIQVDNGVQVNGQFIRYAGVIDVGGQEEVSKKLKVVTTS
jgi:hypothetical protein